MNDMPQVTPNQIDAVFMSLFGRVFVFVPTLFFLKKNDGDTRIVNCVRPSRYLLLSYLAELNQTCYMTSPHDNGVREQHFFRPSIRLSSVHQLHSLLLP